MSTSAVTRPTLQCIAGHAVTQPSLVSVGCCDTCIAYAASSAHVALLYVRSEDDDGDNALPPQQQPPSPSTTTLLPPWCDMRVCALEDEALEQVAFVHVHARKPLLCVGTTERGVYVTTTTQPTFTSVTRLPLSVTGELTYAACFLTRRATAATTPRTPPPPPQQQQSIYNHRSSSHHHHDNDDDDDDILVLSSALKSGRAGGLLSSRLSLWCLRDACLLWRGPMAPLCSLCAFASECAFAACGEQTGVCYFTVHDAHDDAAHVAATTATATATAAVSTSALRGGHGVGKHASAVTASAALRHDVVDACAPLSATTTATRGTTRHRVRVTMCRCTVVDELAGVRFVQCVADVDDAAAATATAATDTTATASTTTFLALTSCGHLVAFDRVSGAVLRWMDCKVSTATSLCRSRHYVVLAGELVRFFGAQRWDVRGKLRHDKTTTTTTTTSRQRAAYSAVVTCASDRYVLLFSPTGELSVLRNATAVRGAAPALVTPAASDAHNSNNNEDTHPQRSASHGAAAAVSGESCVRAGKQLLLQRVSRFVPLARDEAPLLWSCASASLLSLASHNNTSNNNTTASLSLCLWSPVGMRLLSHTLPTTARAQHVACRADCAAYHAEARVLLTYTRATRELCAYAAHDDWREWARLCLADVAGVPPLRALCCATSGSLFVGIGDDDNDDDTRDDDDARVTATTTAATATLCYFVCQWKDIAHDSRSLLLQPRGQTRLSSLPSSSSACKGNGNDGSRSVVQRLLCFSYQHSIDGSGGGAGGFVAGEASMLGSALALTASPPTLVQLHTGQVRVLPVTPVAATAAGASAVLLLYAHACTRVDAHTLHEEHVPLPPALQQQPQQSSTTTTCAAREELCDVAYDVRSDLLAVCTRRRVVVCRLRSGDVQWVLPLAPSPLCSAAHMSNDNSSSNGGDAHTDDARSAATMTTMATTTAATSSSVADVRVRALALQTTDVQKPPRLLLCDSRGCVRAYELTTQTRNDGAGDARASSQHHRRSNSNNSTHASAMLATRDDGVQQQQQQQQQTLPASAPPMPRLPQRARTPLQCARPHALNSNDTRRTCDDGGSDADNNNSNKTKGGDGSSNGSKGNNNNDSSSSHHDTTTMSRARTRRAASAGAPTTRELSARLDALSDLMQQQQQQRSVHDGSLDASTGRAHEMTSEQQQQQQERRQQRRRRYSTASNDSNHSSTDAAAACAATHRSDTDTTAAAPLRPPPPRQAQRATGSVSPRAPPHQHHRSQEQQPLLLRATPPATDDDAAAPAATATTTTRTTAAMMTTAAVEALTSKVSLSNVDVSALTLTTPRVHAATASTTDSPLLLSPTSRAGAATARDNDDDALVRTPLRTRQQEQQEAQHDKATCAALPATAQPTPSALSPARKGDVPLAEWQPPPRNDDVNCDSLDAPRQRVAPPPLPHGHARPHTRDKTSSRSCTHAHDHDAVAPPTRRAGSDDSSRSSRSSSGGSSRHTAHGSVTSSTAATVAEQAHQLRELLLTYTTSLRNNSSSSNNNSSSSAASAATHDVTAAVGDEAELTAASVALHELSSMLTHTLAVMHAQRSDTPPPSSSSSSSLADGGNAGTLDQLFAQLTRIQQQNNVLEQQNRRILQTLTQSSKSD